MEQRRFQAGERIFATGDTLAEQHRGLALSLIAGLATALALRLRHTNTELRALEEA